jgi:hypothetical protein
MDLEIGFDLDKILKSKIGVFALNYYDDKYHSKKTVKPKNNSDRVYLILYKVIGEISLLYIRIFTRLWLRTLSKEDIERIKAGDFDE